jgi:hypothetical protein
MAAPSAVANQPQAVHGHIAARIDRLPLRGAQWRLHLGWFLWILIPGSVVPALLIRTGGIKQSRAVLEQVST